MQKLLAKNNIRNYNEIILNVNEYMICEPDNIYGHCVEFDKLPFDIKKDAHRVISSKALKLYSNSKLYGSVIDVNANTYIFEIFYDATYRIINVEKYNQNIEEVINETNIN